MEKVPDERLLVFYKSAANRAQNQYSPQEVRDVAAEEASMFQELIKYREEYGTVQFK
jgi:hypothetical protein